MQGPTVAFENVNAALKYNDSPENGEKTILFVMCMHNYFHFNGFRLGHPKYSAHHEEGMTVLMEGSEFDLIDIEEHKKWGEDPITIVYLLNTYRFL